MTLVLFAASLVVSTFPLGARADADDDPFEDDAYDPDDELDYGEKFDHLEMQLHLHDDPESGAYFQSKKLMRSGKTRPGVDKSAMSTMRMRVSGGTLKGGSKKEWDPRDTAPRPR